MIAYNLGAIPTCRHCGAPRLGQTKQPPPPGVCCQLDPAGNTVCSDGRIYPPGCPKCPETNVPGVAEYQEVGGQLIPIPPTADDCPSGVSGAPAGAAGTGSALGTLVGLGVLGAVAYGVYSIVK